MQLIGWRSSPSLCRLCENSHALAAAKPPEPSYSLLQCRHVRAPPAAVSTAASLVQSLKDSGGTIEVTTQSGRSFAADTSFIASATLDSTNTLELTIADGVVGSSATLIEARLWYQADPLSFPAALLDPDWLAMDTVVVQTQGNTGQASMADPAVLSLALDGPNSTFATAPVLHWPNRDHYWGEIRIIDQTSGRVLRVEGIGLTYSDIPDASVQVDSSYLIGQSDNRTLGWTRIDPEGEAGTQAAQSLGIQRGRVYTRRRGPRFPSSSVPDTTN